MEGLGGGVQYLLHGAQNGGVGVVAGRRFVYNGALVDPWGDRDTGHSDTQTLKVKRRLALRRSLEFQ